MENSSDQTRLATRLKTLRQEAGLTLDQLAEQSGVSRGTLSRIENADVSPNVQTLGRLCAVYQLSTSRLLAMIEPSFEAHIPAAAQTIWTDAQIGFERRVISPPSNDLTCEVVQAKLKSGANVIYDKPPYVGLEHHLIVQHGTLAVTIDGVRHELNSGDCLRYRLQTTSSFETLSNENAIYYIVIAWEKKR